MEEVIRQADVANCRGVVYLWGLDLDGDATDPVGIAGAVDGLHLVQALARATGPQAPRLYFVTRGAQQIEPKEPVKGLAQASLVGLARVTACEHPDLRCTLVDLDDAGGETLGCRLALELVANSEEDDVALRGSKRFVRRLARASVKQLEETAARTGVSQGRECAGGSTPTTISAPRRSRPSFSGASSQVSLSRSGPRIYRGCSPRRWQPGVRLARCSSGSAG
jgi:hypothetical protein